MPYEEHYQDKKAEKVALRLFYIFVYILLIFYGIMFVTDIAFNMKYRYITVEGLSMQPTLNTNPILDGDKYYQDGVYVLLTQEVDYNDIVIVSRPNDVKGQPNYTVIKRAIAFEGDKISIVKLPTGEYDMFGLPITEYRLVLQKKGEKKPKWCMRTTSKAMRSGTTLPQRRMEDCAMTVTFIMTIFKKA